MWHRFKKYVFGYGSKLRNKIMVLFVVLATVPLLILSVFSLYLLNLSHRYDVSSIELQTLALKREEIAKFFSDSTSALKLQVISTKKAEIDAKQAETILNQLIKDNQPFAEVSFINLNGKELLKIGRTGKVNELLDVSKLPRFVVPRAGSDYVSDVYWTLSGPMVTIASPVYNSNNDIIEIIAAEISLARVIQSVKFTQIGLSGRIILLDKKGRVIAVPDGKHLKIGDSLLGSSRVNRLLSGEELNALASEDIYQGFISHEPVIGAGTRVPMLNWIIIAEWPLSDANAAEDNIRFEALYFMLICIIAVMFMAPIFSHQLTAPIEEIEKNTKEVEKGNFDVNITINTSDELEGLGKSFNEMTKGLKRLKELRNELVYIVTHELRSPVTVIRGYLSLIREGEGGELPPKLKELVMPLTQSSDYLGELVNDLLDVARSEAGRLDIRMDAMSLTRIIQPAISEVRSLAAEHHITIDYPALVEVPRVKADSLRVKQVMVNLLTNAIKYGKEGGYIKIAHEILPDAIITHVEDNGVGMSEEDQKHLFEKFYRSESVGKIIGTGLGLFLTKELVEKMGGTISCRSKKGEGTTFSFSLKRMDV